MIVSSFQGIQRIVYLRDGTEDELAGSLKTGEEATNQVGAHEDEGELIVVLVVDLPDGVVLGVEVLPEPGDRDSGLLVGVLALPLVKRSGGLGKTLEGVLGPDNLNGLLLLLFLLLHDLLGGLLLGLLLGGSVFDSLINELNVTEDGGDLLAADQSVPTGDSGVLGTERLVEDLISRVRKRENDVTTGLTHKLETAGDDGGNENIGERETLTDEVGVGKEVLLNDGNSLEGLLLGGVDGLLVVGVTASQGTEPGTENGEDLGVGE